MHPLEPTDVATLLVAMGGVRDALVVGAPVLDALNVFPVPDGDTGRNMLYTVRGGVESVENDPPVAWREAANRLSDHFNRDSRGNSGFLLSSFFDAFLERQAMTGRFDGSSFVDGFGAGAEAARRALSQPREGTILTATDFMAQALRSASSDSLPGLLDEAILAGHDAVASTPALLPLLRRAGVVDAGALGFVRMIEGMRSALTGAPLAPLRETDYRFPPSEEPTAAEVAAPLTHPFCTQLLLERDGAGSIDELRAVLGRHGDSIVVNERADRIRIHIHTDRPERVEAEITAWGAVLECRVEDMRRQVERAAGHLAGEAQGTTDAEAADDRVAVLAVVPGDGLGRHFVELGASVLGWERDLPSVQQLVDAVASLDAEAAIVLPNDPNLIAGATRAATLVTGKSVLVVPTRTPPSGLAALYGYDPTGGLEANRSAMLSSSALTTSLALHRSATTRVFGKATLRRGDHFVLAGDELLASGAHPLPPLVEAIRGLDPGSFHSLTLFLGRELDAALADSLVEQLGEAFSTLEVSALPGGQGRPLAWIALE